jgi:hypothetical protein
VVRRIFALPAFRRWLYGKARRGTGDLYRGIARPGQQVMVIGDAAKAGKSGPAIASAFEAALFP